MADGAQNIFYKFYTLICNENTAETLAALPRYHIMTTTYGGGRLPNWSLLLWHQKTFHRTSNYLLPSSLNLCPYLPHSTPHASVRHSKVQTFDLNTTSCSQAGASSSTCVMAFFPYTSLFNLKVCLMDLVAIGKETTYIISFSGMKNSREKIVTLGM